MKRALLLLSVAASGCALDASSSEVSLGTSRSALTVDQEILKATCSTSSSVVLGLSQQILDEIALCLKPGVLVKVPSDPKVANASVHPYLVKPAWDALKKATGSRTDVIDVSSMFRTVAQQYFLYRRSDCYPAVAAPGTSNHETGIAIDVSDPDNANWKTVLEANGFKWLGSFDRYHFDYVGSGSVNLRGQDVLAFQRLWNRNNPTDKIAEDGDWGPNTEARMKKSPATGFPIGADCGTPPPATKPWPNLQIDAVAAGVDRFSDGASTAVVDVMEGDEYLVDLTVKNTGDAVAKDVTLGVWVEDPYVLAVHYDIESDATGAFALDAADARTDNPPHDAPGQTFAVKIGEVAPKVQKRIHLKTKAVRYSIGLTDAPDVRVWVKDVPGVYTKTDFATAATNVENRQTWNAGDLKAWAPVDVYSRVRFSFDGGVLEGWSEGGAASVDATDRAKGLVLTTTGDGPQAISPETSFPASDWSAIQIKASTDLVGPTRILFATRDQPTFDPSRAIEVNLPHGAPSELVVRLADHPAWQGVVTRLRIDPPSGKGSVVFDDIRMTNAAPTPATPSDEPADDAGCSCRTAPRSTASPLLALMLAGLLRRVASGRARKVDEDRRKR